MKVFFITFLFLITAWGAQAQTITGLVTDAADGSPLTGANVIVKGTQRGVTTDINGKFSIEASKGESIDFTYIGYVTKTVAVGTAKEINISLASDQKMLGEVVVTALGIKREKKALGYSVQEIKGDALANSKEVNVANSLSGKIAGLQVSSAGSGTGGSTRLTIRGNSSLTGSNQPLIVVDGVPIDNSTNSADNANGSLDYGNGMSDINSDDIASLSVLKGPAAAALYGSRAGNGVILITTKTGKAKKGIGVTYDGSFAIETPLTMIDLQNEYGRGNGGVFDATKGTSWGPLMDGRTVTDYTGQTRPFKAYDNNIQDFIRTGTNQTHAVSMNAGNEDVQFRGGFSYQDINGIIPNNNITKNNVSLRTTANLTSKLKADFKINYIHTAGKNRPYLALNPDNIFNNYIAMPRSVHYSDLVNYRNPDYSPNAWVDGTATMNNPYWTTNLNTNWDKKDRLIGMGLLKYEFTDWLTAQVRYGMDYSQATDQNQLGTGVNYWQSAGPTLSSTGDVTIVGRGLKETNADFLITAQKNNLWGSKFSGSFLAGGNQMTRSWNNQTSLTNGLITPDFYSINNGLNPRTSYDSYEKRINSLYASGQLNYNDYLFLDFTMRNDWSSTLPLNNNSYFYPSIGLGAVISEMLTLPKWISYTKLRASFAEVGNDTDPYNLAAYATPTISGGNPGFTLPTTAPNPNIKPEIIQSTEIGAEFKFLNNRIGLDFTYYKMNSTNQILPINVDPATGYNKRIINAGNIQNSGVEIVLHATPIETKDFSWNLTLNYAKNKNKIISLAPDLPVYYLGVSTDTRLPFITANEGGDYGNIEGSYTLKDPATGLPMLGADGLPIKSSDNKVIGNFQPDFTGGLNNAFTYKNWNFSFLIDWRVGGNIISLSAANAASSGTLAETAKDRATGVQVKGVDQATGKEVTNTVDAQTYWKHMADINERWVYDATSVRLREVSLGYNLPTKWFDKTFIQGMRVNFVGRNLWLIKSNLPGLDPESSYNTSNAQGIEVGAVPSTSTYGFNIKLTL